MPLTYPKETIHIITFEPISNKRAPKSIQELSVVSRSRNVIGTFWRATKSELIHSVWLAPPNSLYDQNDIPLTKHKRWALQHKNHIKEIIYEIIYYIGTPVLEFDENALFPLRNVFQRSLCSLNTVIQSLLVIVYQF